MVEIGVLIAIVGCFVGLAGWLSKRDGKLVADAEWKGTVNAKLDIIVGLAQDLGSLETRVGKLENRVSKIETKVKMEEEK